MRNRHSVMRAVLLGTAVCAIGAAVAYAAPGTGAHFSSATGTVDTTTGDYVATWTESGLGTSGGLIDYTLTADATSTWQCFNGGSNQPQGAPQTGGSGTISTNVAFQPHNGTVKNGSATLSPEVGTASCQGGGLKLCLTSVSYSNVQLFDTTDGIEVDLPSFSKVTIPPPTKHTSGVCTS